MDVIASALKGEEMQRWVAICDDLGIARNAIMPLPGTTSLSFG
jgi:hypothetical protein